MSAPNVQRESGAPHPTVAPVAPAAEETARPGTAITTEEDTITPIPASRAGPETRAAPATRVPTGAPVAASAPTPAATAPDADVAPRTQPALVEETMSFQGKLDAGDRRWRFKFALRTVCILVSLIGIGTTAWFISTANAPNSFGYNMAIGTEVWPSLVTFVASVLWCAIVMLVFFARKRPMHPGACVSLDLIIWLAYIATALFATLAVIDIQTWNPNWDYPTSYSDGREGDYTLLSNNTWVWDNSTSAYGETRYCNTIGYQAVINQTQTCADQDAYVNNLWQQLPNRTRVVMTASVCQYIALGLHIILFIWACIDTHRYRRYENNKDAEKIAAGIVQNMIQNGAIMPPPGPTYGRPGSHQHPYYQIPADQQQQQYRQQQRSITRQQFQPQPQPYQQQAYPMMPMYSQGAPQQHMYQAPGGYASGPMPQTPFQGSRNEKSTALRYG